MSREYPQEVYEQQAKVKREIRKLNRMRTEHLIATGQMPPEYYAAKRGVVPPPGYVIKEPAANAQRDKAESAATSPRPSSSH